MARIVPRQTRPARISFVKCLVKRRCSLGNWVNSSVPNKADVNFILYLAAFNLLWTAYVLLIYGHVQALGEGTFAHAAASIGVRLLLWIMPVYLYLKFVDRVDAACYLQLSSNWRRGLLIGLGLSALDLVGSILRFGQPHMAWNLVTWNTVLRSAFCVGFVEEIPFRGFILSKLTARVNFWIANFLTSVLFVSAHLPGWLMLHLFTVPRVLTIFIFSFTMGVVLKYSRSLWTCIAAHNGNDAISFFLFHDRS